MNSNDFEVLIEQILFENKKSRVGLWKCARYTWQLYDRFGLYERDFTAALSKEAAISIDTILHWRKAWDLFRRVLESFPSFKIGCLSISHFYTAADYAERQSIEWLHDFLVVARDESWSSRRFAAELATANDDSGTSEWLHKKIGLEVARLEKLYGSSEQAGLSSLRRKRLRLALKLLESVK